MSEMCFRRVPEPDGDRISVIGGIFEPEITISKELLEQADRRFLDHGDGLIVFTCVEGTATYGVTGEVGHRDESPSYRSVTARLLQVRRATTNPPLSPGGESAES